MMCGRRQTGDPVLAALVGQRVRREDPVIPVRFRVRDLHAHAGLGITLGPIDGAEQHGRPDGQRVLVARVDFVAQEPVGLLRIARGIEPHREAHARTNVERDPAVPPRSFVLCVLGNRALHVKEVERLPLVVVGDPDAHVGSPLAVAQNQEIELRSRFRRFRFFFGRSGRKALRSHDLDRFRRAPNAGVVAVSCIDRRRSIH